jgi:hypothetical protein
VDVRRLRVLVPAKEILESSVALPRYGEWKGRRNCTFNGEVGQQLRQDSMKSSKPFEFFPTSDEDTKS